MPDTVYVVRRALPRDRRHFADSSSAHRRKSLCRAAAWPIMTRARERRALAVDPDLPGSREPARRSRAETAFCQESPGPSSWTIRSRMRPRVARKRPAPEPPSSRNARTRGRTHASRARASAPAASATALTSSSNRPPVRSPGSPPARRTSRLGQPQDSRTTRVGGRTASSMFRAPCQSSARAARPRRPCSRKGMDTVVSGGARRRLSGLSLKPVTATSAGTWKPRSCSPRRNQKAKRSLAAAAAWKS